MRGARPTPKSPWSQSPISKSGGSSKRSAVLASRSRHPVEKKRAGLVPVDVARHAGDRAPLEDEGVRMCGDARAPLAPVRASLPRLESPVAIPEAKDAELGDGLE